MTRSAASSTSRCFETDWRAISSPLQKLPQRLAVPLVQPVEQQPAAAIGKRAEDGVVEVGVTIGSHLDAHNRHPPGCMSSHELQGARRPRCRAPMQVGSDGDPTSGRGCELGARPVGDRLQGADGRLDVGQLELPQQLRGRSGDVRAEAGEERLALAREVELLVAADQPVALDPPQQVARRRRVQRARGRELFRTAWRAAAGPNVAIRRSAYQVSGSTFRWAR